MRSLFILSTLLYLLLSSLSSHASEPKAIIETALEQLEPHIKPDNKTGLIHAIERYVTPLLDHERISKLVLGPHWKRASMKQKQRFKSCFARQLQDTQAQTLLDSKHADWQFSELHYNQNKSKAAISFSLQGSLLNRTLTLRLHKEKTDWRIYDAALNGLSLLKSFRDDYAVKIESQGLTKSLASLCQNHPKPVKHVTLAGSNWEPFIGRALPGHGLSVELVRAVFKRAGYETSMEFAPWQTVLKGMKKGKYDVLVANWKTKKRQNMLLFSEPYFTNKLIVISPDRMINSTQDLNLIMQKKGAVLGLMTDYAYGNVLPEKAEIQRHQHYTPLLRKLASGNLTATLMDQCVANYQLHQLPNLENKLKVSAHPIEHKPLHISVLKNHPASTTLIKDFNIALKDYIASEQYKQLLKHYQVKHPSTQ